MATLIKPMFETCSRNYFDSTKHRFFYMEKPIQPTSEKESDLMAYIATPIIDTLLVPIFAIEAVIHLLNATVSLARAVYLWTLNQQQTASFIDERSSYEFEDAYSSVKHALFAVVAQYLNATISLMSLVTRPVASIMHGLFGENENNIFQPRIV